MPVAGAAKSQAKVNIPPAPTEENPIRLKAGEPVRTTAAVATAGHVKKADPPASTQPQQIPDQSDFSELESDNNKKGKGNAAAIIAAILILGVAGAATIWLASEWKKDPVKPNNPSSNSISIASKTMAKKDWINNGWKKDAAKVLGDFLVADSPEEKLKYSIPNDGVMEDIKAYCPSAQETADTPITAFSFVEGNLMDRERGIFIMQYDRPAQIDIREYFAPIGKLETVMGQENPGLIEMAYRIDEESLTQVVGINAVFKKTEKGLKLDASVFIQGKFRTFKEFTEYPQPGKSKVFRIVISEIISHALRDDATQRSYKLMDFAYQQDFVNISVEADSDLGKTLSIINWRGTNKRVFPRTATVELVWTDTAPSVLELKEIICWEFLGVGGEKGNTDPVVSESSATAPSPKAPTPSGENP